MAEQKQVYTCKTCGAVATEKGHLCTPIEEMATCAYCSKQVPHAKHYCKGKMEDLKYVCDQCGRLAPSADLLCKPSEVPSS